MNAQFLKYGKDLRIRYRLVSLHIDRPDHRGENAHDQHRHRRTAQQADPPPVAMQEKGKPVAPRHTRPHAGFARAGTDTVIATDRRFRIHLPFSPADIPKGNIFLGAEINKALRKAALRAKPHISA